MLPRTFGAGRGRGLGGGSDRVGGGVPGVTGHVGSSGGVTGGAGNGSGSCVNRFSGGGMGGHGGGARLAACDLATNPGPRCFDRLARPVVFRVLLLEEGQHVLGAVGGPERQ